MRLNDAGISLIKSFEQCRLACYADAVGLPTIGWGHRTKYPIGMLITQDDADRLLAEDLSIFSQHVEGAIMDDNLTDNQFSACVCLAFNIGASAFARSTLAKLINEGRLADAAQEFPKWDRAGGKVLAGLTRRRLAEQKLFNS